MPQTPTTQPCIRYGQVAAGVAGAVLGAGQAILGASEAIVGIAGTPETGVSLALVGPGIFNLTAESVATLDGVNLAYAGLHGTTVGTTLGSIGAQIAGQTGQSIGDGVTLALGVASLARGSNIQSPGFLVNAINFVASSVSSSLPSWAQPRCDIAIVNKCVRLIVLLVAIYGALILGAFYVAHPREAVDFHPVNIGRLLVFLSCIYAMILMGWALGAELRKKGQRTRRDERRGDDSNDRATLGRPSHPFLVAFRRHPVLSALLILFLLLLPSTLVLLSGSPGVPTWRALVIAESLAIVVLVGAWVHVRRTDVNH